MSHDLFKVLAAVEAHSPASQEATEKGVVIMYGAKDCFAPFAVGLSIGVTTGAIVTAVFFIGNR